MYAHIFISIVIISLPGDLAADCHLLAVAAARLQRMLLARCNQLVALPPVLGTSWQCNPSRLSLRYCGLQVNCPAPPSVPQHTTHVFIGRAASLMLSTTSLTSIRSLLTVEVQVGSDCAHSAPAY